MNPQSLVLILIFVPATLSQLFAVARQPSSATAARVPSCNGYLQFAGRAALDCGTAAGAGGVPCCPCPGIGTAARLLGLVATPPTFILNSCVPACCPSGIYAPNVASTGVIPTAGGTGGIVAAPGGLIPVVPGGVLPTGVGTGVVPSFPTAGVVPTVGTGILGRK